MTEGGRFTFRKEERLAGKKRIENLFHLGESFLVYPFKVVFLEYECPASEPVSILISIPKKRLKRAVARNRMKRLVREAYRMNKSLLRNDYPSENLRTDIAFIYIKDSLSGYDSIEKSVCKALRRVSFLLKERRREC